MANLRDFLRQKYPVSLDAPSRSDPPLNQGGKPTGPQRLTGREIRRVQQSITAPGPSHQTVIELNRFPSLSIVPFSLTIAGTPGANLILTAPDKERIFLTFRNASASAGSLLIGFGVVPNPNNAVFVLVPGGHLIFDVVIPQDDVWIATDIATTFGSISYANSLYNF